MTAPKRIQLKRTKGWRMPPGAVKVDRTTKWGNPFTIEGARQLAFLGSSDAEFAAMCVTYFRQWIQQQRTDITGGGPPSLDDVRRELRGKDLACWCAPGAPCHADVLLEIANEELAP